jgi:RNA:NAD 2'-phosphotransferase (TPT1/KptA family)
MATKLEQKRITIHIFNEMKRLTVALKAFALIIFSKDISLTLRHGKKNELQFEQGCFADATRFLSGLKKRGNVPEYILEQYKEVLTDYDYNN